MAYGAEKFSGCWQQFYAICCVVVIFLTKNFYKKKQKIMFDFHCAFCVGSYNKMIYKLKNWYTCKVPRIKNFDTLTTQKETIVFFFR